MAPRRIKVTDTQLRALFNASAILAKIDSGEVVLVYDRDVVPLTLPSGEPPGTRSQLAYIYDLKERQRVAIVHRYLRPDGTVGTSGMWDPKWLLHEGDIYSL